LDNIEIWIEKISPRNVLHSQNAIERWNPHVGVVSPAISQEEKALPLKNVVREIFGS